VADTLAPYKPEFIYRCVDPQCCLDGCPDVICSVCKREWPCPDFKEAHTPAQVDAQKRWADRKLGRERVGW